jgi:hypothetical protein
LLYAIGEIALVVIGILIALQINNWNEWRKDRTQEKVLLSQLHQEFVANKAELQRTLAANKIQSARIDSMWALVPVDIKLYNRKFLDSTFNNFRTGTATFNVSNAIISTINSSNTIDLIRDDSLRLKILSWKNVLEDYLEDEREAVRFVHEQFVPYLHEQGAHAKNRLLDERVNLEFLTSIKFESLLRRRRGQLKRIIGELNISQGSAFSQARQEVKLVESFVEEIIELTAPYND